VIATAVLIIGILLIGRSASSPTIVCSYTTVAGQIYANNCSAITPTAP
jgi:hypothetical protein